MFWFVCLPTNDLHLPVFIPSFVEQQRRPCSGRAHRTIVVMCSTIHDRSGIRNNCENNQPTEDVPQASTSILAERTDLQASLGHDETKTSDIDLNPKQPVTESKRRDRGTVSSEHSNSPMCEKTTSICRKSIYENDSEYRLNSNDEFKIVTN
jgi:hypothetical protein